MRRKSRGASREGRKGGKRRGAFPRFFLQFNHWRYQFLTFYGYNRHWVDVSFEKWIRGGRVTGRAWVVPYGRCKACRSAGTGKSRGRAVDAPTFSDTDRWLLARSRPRPVRSTRLRNNDDNSATRRALVWKNTSRKTTTSNKNQSELITGIARGEEWVNRK